MSEIDERLTKGAAGIEAAKARGADPKAIGEAEMRYVKLLGAREYLADWHQQIVDEVLANIGHLDRVSTDATQILKEFVAELQQTQKAKE